MIMDETIICVAGKNNIAINVSEYLRKEFPSLNLIACCNRNDDGVNGFQRSFKSYCILNNIEIKSLDQLYSLENLVFLSLEFDKIINPNLFLSKQLFNIHFSYLPEYKGMYTSALPILNGESYSGVTLHKIDAGIDTGDIISQEKITLPELITADNLYKTYIDFGTKIVTTNLPSIINKNFQSRLQSSKLSTYYSKKTIDYSNLKINLNKTANEISRQIRAFVFPAYQLPKVFGFEIYAAEITDEKSESKAGILLNDTEFNIVVSSIDYNISLAKDLRNKLFAFAKEGDIEGVKHYKKNGYDIFQRSKEGWDIAIIAAYNGRIEFLDYLIENFTWDLNTKNYNGTTLIMYLMTFCLKDNDPATLEKFLKKYNFSKNQVDYYGRDIIYYAQKSKNLKIIQLIEYYFK